MMSFRNHAASSELLSDPGERDITAHVNFSYLKDIAMKTGYEVEADQSLRSWLGGIWEEKDFDTLWRERDGRWKLQWKQLFVGMGETFRVLELRKRER
jgi:SAM-dependent MidA family methyltransferase